MDNDPTPGPELPAPGITRDSILHLVELGRPLCADGFEPVIGTSGGGYPVYAPEVEHFFGEIASDLWLDYAYDPSSASRMLDSPERVRRATLDEMRSMLTYCCRAERFCDGAWGGAVTSGAVRRLVERLEAIAAEMRA